MRTDSHPICQILICCKSVLPHQPQKHFISWS